MGELVYGHVLIVDDYEINQLILKKFLLIFGYSSDVAKNGLEALRICNERVYDFIFMDLQMPEMGGVECTYKIRQHPDPRLSQAPIIAVTANNSPEDKLNCQEAGMNDFLEKPLTSAGLTKILKKWNPENHLL